MPSKDRDVEVDEPPREKRLRSKTERGKSDRDRDREQRRKTTSSRTSKSKMTESDSHSHSRHHRTRDASTRERSSSLTDLVPELSRTSPNVSTDRVSLPYPTFSKAHSRECVHSRDDVSAPRRTDPLTPEATDIGKDEKGRSKSADFSTGRKVSSSSKKDPRPPTPPDTDLSARKSRSATPEILRRERDERPSSRVSNKASRPASRNDEKSRVSSKSKSSSQATFIKSPAFPPGEFGHLRPKSSRKRTPSGQSTKQPERADADSSPESAQDSSPQTPTQMPQFPPPAFPDGKNVPLSNVQFNDSDTLTPSHAPGSDSGPPPPPPPPPPLNIDDVPRVDYLLQNGGLTYPAPRTFLSVIPRPNGTRPSNPPLTGAQVLFAPFFNLLDQYQTVLSKQGSVAVATGHRSVARRLLDRLENVFSRNLPAQGCSCIMCEKSHELHRGLGWGEVLEWVSGRVDLPQWPPFDLGTLGIKAAEISADLPRRPASPVKLDPDIAEEFKEHYLRQSKKVRHAVDKWLTNCAETPAPPPQDVDDETLTFAIMTNLDQDDRPYFNALLSGAKELQPTVRAPTPMRKARTDFIVKAGLSLQRLYRLPQAPRDAETASYLIKNPHTHDLIVTMSDINNSEWEILTSGRFEGFLWSGADGDELNTPTAESRGATPASGYFVPPRSAMSPSGRGTPGISNSRGTTPFSSYSRGTTPASFASGTSAGHTNRQPVSNDEETEVAILAEVEREIYQGMEALEDAFELLHEKAEVVRTALRQRGAGLMLNLQHRRRIDVLPTLGSGNSQQSGYERPAWAVGASECEGDAVSESDWGADEVELAPDDSASNISSSRHRRPKRRTERRTPAPIEEDDEER